MGSSPAAHPPGPGDQGRLAWTTRRRCRRRGPLLLPLLRGVEWLHANARLSANKPPPGKATPRARGPSPGGRERGLTGTRGQSPRTSCASGSADAGVGSSLTIALAMARSVLLPSLPTLSPHEMQSQPRGELPLPVALLSRFQNESPLPNRALRQTRACRGFPISLTPRSYPPSHGPGTVAVSQLCSLVPKKIG